MKNGITIPSERIVNKIYIIRNQKVMLDKDLAELYGVEKRVLNQAVKRNIKRFPADFMFELDKKEIENSKSQIVISSWGGARKGFFAFTEQGVAMLASILNSDRAISVNIQIIRTFVKIRELLATNEALHRKIMGMERKYDNKIKKIFDILQLLLADDKESKRKIGFKP